MAGTPAYIIIIMIPTCVGGLQVWLEHADWRMQGEVASPHLALQLLKKARQV